MNEWERKKERKREREREKEGGRERKGGREGSESRWNGWIKGKEKKKEGMGGQGSIEHISRGAITEEGRKASKYPLENE